MLGGRCLPLQLIMRSLQLVVLQPGAHWVPAGQQAHCYERILRPGRTQQGIQLCHTQQQQLPAPEVSINRMTAAPAAVAAAAALSCVAGIWCLLSSSVVYGMHALHDYTPV
eukprot:GHRQ01034193.1.p1 GENE.GHRQ01034193.1~~GHRQ01034193.1.p1  ORF type:complete len:111 (+),score=52.72 GHRQ01034193.1:471-803(+)